MSPQGGPGGRGHARVAATLGGGIGESDRLGPLGKADYASRVFGRPVGQLLVGDDECE